MSECQCDVCQLTRRVRSAMVGAWDEQREMIRELYDHLQHAQMDADYYRSVVTGSWPSADEVLKYHRDKRIAAEQSNG